MAFRLSSSPWGRGTLEFEGECDGACPYTVVNEDAAARPSGAVGFGLDLLAAPHELLRLGMAFQVVPTFSLSAETNGASSDEQKRTIGSELAWTFELEVQIPLEDVLAVAIRSRVGPWFVFPGSALRRDSRAFEHLCDTESVATECDPSTLTRVGWTYGVGIGPVYRLSDVVSLRADVAYQIYGAKLFDFAGRGPGWEGTQRYFYDGHRLWLSLGVELWG